MKKFIKNTANSIRTKAIRLAATRRSGEGYIDTAVKILIAVVLGALLLAGLYHYTLSGIKSRTVGHAHVEPAYQGYVQLRRRAGRLIRGIRPAGDAVPHRTYERGMDGSPAQADL